MIKLKKDLSGYEFSPEGGRAVWHYIHYLLVHTYSISYPEWPSPWPNQEVLVAADFKNHSVKWYFVISSMKVFNDFLEEVLKEPELLQKINDFITTQRERGVTQLKGVNLATCTDAELNKALNHYFDHFQHLLLVACNVRRADRALLNAIRTKHKDRADEVLRMSSILTQPSFAMAEELALLDLAVQIEKENIQEKDIEVGLKKIHDSYAWSVMGYHDEKPKGMSYYTDKLSQIKSHGAEKTLAEVKGKIDHDRNEREKYVATLDKEDQVLAGIASRSAYLKDYFKSSINELEYFAEPLFEELAKRTGLIKNYIKDLAPNEILGLLDGDKIDQTLFDERLRHNVIMYGLGDIYEFAGKDADEFETTYLTVKNNNVKEYKGRVACKGKVTGKVAVVKDHSDFGKLQQGQILVVVNTSPDYVPIMQKAAAIVAEEGGLTSHVSVVSREFGIPCIVGINHITQFLKDGDMVEVDANSGVVKILEN